MSEWSGYVPRNDLVAWCRNESVQVTQERNKIWDAMQNKNLTDQQYDELCCSYYSKLGVTIALRKVIDWAQENKKESKNV